MALPIIRNAKARLPRLSRVGSEVFRCMAGFIQTTEQKAFCGH
jgi:hypothetical protein